jgi:hypothetical protein
MLETAVHPEFYQNPGQFSLSFDIFWGQIE